MGAGKADPGDGERRIVGEFDQTKLVEQGRGGRCRQARQTTSAIVAPDAGIVVEPAAVAEVNDVASVRPATAFAASFGTVEPDHGGQLAPVDRIEPAHGGTDRHGGQPRPAEGARADAITADLRPPDRPAFSASGVRLPRRPHAAVMSNALAVSHASGVEEKPVKRGPVILEKVPECRFGDQSAGSWWS